MRTSDCRKDIVTIRFEKTKREFHIHKGVLSFWSDYYRGMLNGPFREAKEKTLTSDEDPYIFAIFESFCYTNQLTDGAVTKGTDLLFTTLVRLWIFGDRVIAPALQNMAMTALMEKSVTGNVVPLERVSATMAHRQDRTHDLHPVMAFGTRHVVE